jgi:peptidoglycan/LPS O-acetylase OafA/YrhL
MVKRLSSSSKPVKTTGLPNRVKTVSTERFGSPALLRLLAAWLVFHSHHYAVHGLAEPAVPLLNLSWDGFAVVVFFAISGYYVTGSYFHRGLWGYLQARLLRIFPALVVCTLLTAGALGFFSKLPLAAYWVHKQTLQFITHNALLGVFPIARRLPGVFVGNPLPMVNASLWTLPYELLAYAVLPVLWVKKTWPVVMVLAISFGLWVLGHLVANTVILKWLHHLDLYYIGVFLAVFLGAGWLGRLSPAWHGVVFLYALVCVGFGWAIVYKPFMQWAILACVTIGTIMLATRVNADSVLHKKVGRVSVGDPSYGMYLYAFPMQQLAYQLTRHWGSNQFWGSYAMALLGCLLMGWLSWHLIEQPMLTLKQSPFRLKTLREKTNTTS